MWIELPLALSAIGAHWVFVSIAVHLRGITWHNAISVELVVKFCSLIAMGFLWSFSFYTEWYCCSHKVPHNDNLCSWEALSQGRRMLQQEMLIQTCFWQSMEHIDYGVYPYR